MIRIMLIASQCFATILLVLALVLLWVVLPIDLFVDHKVVDSILNYMGAAFAAFAILTWSSVALHRKLAKRHEERGDSPDENSSS
jgi:membrane protein implicated in regulation of membrane protease activity